MHTISDNDLYQRLAYDNPWWEFSDETKVKFRHPPRRMYYQQFYERVRNLSAAPSKIHVLAGPLRSGKTVILRQLLAELIEDGLAPSRVMYCSMTTPSYAATDLLALFELFTRQFRHKPNQRLYVFFDEVQYIEGWQEALHKLKEIRPTTEIIAAVSSGSPALVTGTIDQEKMIETTILPPLTFLEFLKFRGTDEKLFISPNEQPDEGPGKVMLRQNAMGALNTEFHRYVNFGGFLEGVIAGSDGTPAPAFIRDGAADRVLHKDFASLHGVNDPQDLNRLLGLVAYNTGREVSIDDLAKSTRIAKNTVRKYLDYLEHAFLIHRVSRIDRDAKRFQRAMAFKVYLTTPCLYAALFGPVKMEDPVYARLVETALVGQWLGSVSIDQLAYASWRGGSVDLVTMNPQTDQPSRVYDLDWENSYGRKSKGPAGLVSFVEGTNRDAKVYILDRSTARPASMRGIEITLAPVSLYAYMIGRNPEMIA